MTRALATEETVRRRTWALRILAPTAFAILVLALWQLYASVSGIAESTLPAPTEVADALWTNRTLLVDNAWVTIREILLGFAVAIVVGASLGALINASKLLEHALYPWLVVSQIIPIVALAPIVLIWTGFNIWSKVVVIALVSFFPISVNTIDGLRGTDPRMLDLLRTFGARPWQRFRFVELPAAAPFVFSGMRVGAALAVIGAVFAEWVASSEGLGHLILVLNNQTSTAEVFATIAVLAVVGLALVALVSLAERLLLPWYFEERSREGGELRSRS